MRPFIGVVFRFAARGFLLVLVLPVLYLSEPFLRLRLGTMYTQRFGHLALNTETFLRKMVLNGAPPRTFYLFFGYDPANRQLFEMWKRLRGFPIRLIESRWGARLMFAWRPVLKRTRFWEPHRITGSDFYLFNHTEPTLSFTEDEEKRGREKLMEMGIGEDDWFICFHARDGAFLREWRPEIHWDITDVKNVDITNYLKASEYIASLGGYALRFGAIVEKPLPETGNPRIIDYATKFRSDFMDIYLGAKCLFFIASPSGASAIADIFNVPIVSANQFPYNNAPCHHRSVSLPQLLTTTDGNRLVSYLEAQEAGYYVGWKEAVSVHESMHIFNMRELASDDIVDGCKDMMDILNGRKPPAEAREIQDLYGKLYLSHAPEYQHAAKIGARFAMKYRDLIVPKEDNEKIAASR